MEDLLWVQDQASWLICPFLGTGGHPFGWVSVINYFLHCKSLHFKSGVDETLVRNFLHDRKAF